MEFDIKFWIQILVYAGTFGTMYGSFKTTLDYLEKKMDKHNDMQNRLAVAENSLKSVHHRLDELKEELKEVKEHED